MIRLLGYLVLMTIFAINVHAVERPEAASPKYVVSVSLQEEEVSSLTGRTSTKTLGQPTLLVTANKDAKLHVGQSLGAMQAPAGTQLTVRVGPAAIGKVHVDGVLELSSGKDVDAGIVVREATSIHFQKSIELNETVRALVRQSKDKELWFELRVTAREK